MRRWSAWPVFLLVLVLSATRCLCQVNYVVEDEVRNLTLTSDLLDVFNLRRTVDLWPELMQEGLIENANCTNDLEAYFDGVEHKKIWALKSEFISY